MERLREIKRFLKGLPLFSDVQEEKEDLETWV
jgi:hypothetical protein